MELIGVIVKIKDKEIIKSKKEGGKDFHKREFWLETDDGYKQTICLECHGEKVDLLDDYTEGQEVVISININGRIVDNRCWNTIQAWRIQLKEEPK